jgi:hypothetical protein
MPTLTLGTAVNDGAAATATLQIFEYFLAGCAAFSLWIYSFCLLTGIEPCLIIWMVIVKW